MTPSRHAEADIPPPSVAPEGPGLTRLMGARVAAARRRSGLTLAAVAERNGVSPGYISQIESGTANPTIRALDQVARALDTDVAALFGAVDEAAVDEAATEPFEPYHARVALAAGVDGMSGVWDRTALGARRLSARLVHGGAGDHDATVTHPGEEFVIVLRGRCTLHLGDVARVLAEGDSVHFAASTPHRISAPSPDLTFSVVMSEGGS